MAVGLTKKGRLARVKDKKLKEFENVRSAWGILEIE